MSGFYWNTAAPTPLFEFSLSAGVLTVSATGIAKLLFEEQGNPGGLVEIDLSGRSWSIADDTATNEFVGRHGTTASVAWGSAMPFFAYLVNKDNTSAGVKLALSRDPRAGLSPASTDNIGYTSNAAAVSSQSNFFLAHTTNTGYNGVPCTCIGSVRATCDDSVGGIWTFAALAAGQDGYGKFQEGVVFTFPVGQNGAAATRIISADGGTLPTFTTETGSYTLSKDGIVQYKIDLSNTTGGTAGIGANSILAHLPLSQSIDTSSWFGSGYYRNDSIWVGLLPDVAGFSTGTYATFRLSTNASSIVSNATLAHADQRRLRGNISYKAF